MTRTPSSGISTVDHVERGAGDVRLPEARRDDRDHPAADQLAGVTEAEERERGRADRDDDARLVGGQQGDVGPGHVVRVPVGDVGDAHRLPDVRPGDPRLHHRPGDGLVADLAAEPAPQLLHLRLRGRHQEPALVRGGDRLVQQPVQGLEVVTDARGTVRVAVSSDT